MEIFIIIRNHLRANHAPPHNTLQLMCMCVLVWDNVSASYSIFLLLCEEEKLWQLWLRTDGPRHTDPPRCQWAAAKRGSSWKAADVWWLGWRGAVTLLKPEFMTTDFLSFFSPYVCVKGRWLRTSPTFFFFFAVMDDLREYLLYIFVLSFICFHVLKVCLHSMLLFFVYFRCV